jgi:hypothetical protein
MRQTLWAEQMVVHRADECVKADEYIHVHVIPPDNDQLLKKLYPISGLPMENTWRNRIVHQDRYTIISPEAFLNPIRNAGNYQDLMGYLKQRYW